ncbi:MAG: sugar ABC transporter permease, partial [Lachnospiraceae bacterium]|nr:sugar ABC transporter permease [Lachnospiraceae bacterium]
MIDNPVSGEFVWFENFVNVAKNGAFKLAGKNTLKFSFIAMPLAVVLSLLLAIMLDKEIPLRSHFRTFFLTPMMVPVASIVLIVQVMFHYNGAVNDFLGAFGVAKTDWLKSDYAQVVIIFLFIWK